MRQRQMRCNTGCIAVVDFVNRFDGDEALAVLLLENVEAGMHDVRLWRAIPACEDVWDAVRARGRSQGGVLRAWTFWKLPSLEIPHRWMPNTVAERFEAHLCARSCSSGPSGRSWASHKSRRGRDFPSRSATSINAPRWAAKAFGPVLSMGGIG